jgi:hypothetical protein
MDIVRTIGTPFFPTGSLSVAPEEQKISPDIHSAEPQQFILIASIA